VLRGFFLNEALAEVTKKKKKKIKFPPESTGIVAEESSGQDMALKAHSLECPLAPGL